MALTIGTHLYDEKKGGFCPRCGKLQRNDPEYRRGKLCMDCNTYMCFTFSSNKRKLKMLKVGE